MVNPPTPPFPFPSINPTMTGGILIGTVVAFAGQVEHTNQSKNTAWPKSSDPSLSCTPEQASSPPSPSDTAPVIPIEQMGWMLCDGRSLLISQYPELFAFIGYLYGKGDGDGQFNIPDYRGLFLRGFNGASGMDPDASKRLNYQGSEGGVVGSMQCDALQTHQHPYSQAPPPTGTGEEGTSGQPSSEDTLTGGPTNSLSGQNTVHTSTETRPKNVYVNYIIKVK